MLIATKRPPLFYHSDRHSNMANQTRFLRSTADALVIHLHEIGKRELPPLAKRAIQQLTQLQRSVNAIEETLRQLYRSEFPDLPPSGPYEDK